VATLTKHDLLTKQLAESKAKGLGDLEAGGLLIAQEWQLQHTYDALARAALLSKNLGGLVIGFLMFSKRVRIARATKDALLGDPFFGRHGCLYGTAVPSTDFARRQMKRIWSRQPVDPADASDAGFAAYYATLIAPFSVDAWMMLAELRGLGFCPKIDKRDHVQEGIECARRFLEANQSADPEFRALLSEGMDHLSKMGKA
jgi:hypothetical protein